MCGVIVHVARWAEARADVESTLAVSAMRIAAAACLRAAPSFLAFVLVVHFGAERIGPFPSIGIGVAVAAVLALAMAKLAPFSE